MHSTRLLGGLVFAFSLVSIGLAVVLDCHSVSIGGQPATNFACLKDDKFYTNLERFNICRADDKVACCLPGKEMNTKNCKPLQFLVADPHVPNPPSCYGKEKNGVPAPSLMCKGADKIPMPPKPPGIGEFCPKDTLPVCCIRRAEAELVASEHCVAIESPDALPAFS